VLVGLAAASAQTSGPGRVPRTWDDREIATLELPLATRAASPKHVPASYYYRIPVRPIYKQYPVYAPDHEPPGYMERLKQIQPEIIWDDQGHAPPLQTEADWIAAGEQVFDAQIGPSEGFGIVLDDVRRRDWYQKGRVPVTRDGVLPFVAYVIREKGKVELRALGCAMCHTRVMPDGTILKGAQGNFAAPVNASVGPRRPAPLASLIRSGLWAVPWLDPDPLATLSPEQIDQINEATPPGVLARHRSSPVYPVHIPDLIGVKDRRYLDATGLQRHRSPADLMR